MTNKKNYWLFSIILLASAESTYDAWGCKRCKDWCCPEEKNSKKPEEKNSRTIEELMAELNGRKV